MTAYKKIDFENWERKDHFLYYTEKLKVGYSMTVSLDVTNIVNKCKENNIKFYPAFIYCVSSVINETYYMRLFKNSENELCYWDYVVPNYTIFHDDDKTFSDMWTDYSPDFKKFYSDITGDIEKYGAKKGVKIKDNQPPNFYCISCVPWISFTGYCPYTAGGTPSLFPIITFGKYTNENNRISMPFNITISHAACDGYHTGKFFEDVQKKIDSFEP